MNDYLFALCFGAAIASCWFMFSAAFVGNVRETLFFVCLYLLFACYPVMNLAAVLK